MQILPSARKHGIADADIEHAWRHAIRFIEHEYHGEIQILIIGPDRGGMMLEIIAVPTGRPTRVIHADRLRPSRYDHLR